MHRWRIRDLTMAAAISATALFVHLPASEAGFYGDAPWCAVTATGDGDAHWDCEYNTVEACVPNVLAGNRGSCTQNPYYRPPPAAAVSSHKRRERFAQH
jgi:hypothetical protein